MHIYRREGPRIGVEVMCWELLDTHEETSLAVDLSAHGLCIERPYAGGPTRRRVPLQIELPGLDEVIWARGEACFDMLLPTRSPRGGALGLVRRTGYRISAAATRDLRNLRELVMETYKQELGAQIDQAIASCCQLS